MCEDEVWEGKLWDNAIFSMNSYPSMKLLYNLQNYWCYDLMNNPAEIIENLYIGNAKCVETEGTFFNGIVSVMVKPPAKVPIIVSFCILLLCFYQGIDVIHCLLV
jgi:hypothetical protein